MMTAEPAPGAPRRYFRVLTVAGSDSGGGAGIQADLKTIAALGGYGMSAITALTAQNTLGVAAIHPVPEPFVAEQIDVVLADIGADAVKIGMLYSAALIRTVAERLRRHRAVNVVLDPVMVAQSGDRLLEEDAVAALAGELMPLADVATPNIPEAEAFLGSPIRTVADQREAARRIAAFGCRSVLVKGGHLEDAESVDVLFFPDEPRWVELRAPRLASRNTHGTGCTLSSAIAARLARGDGIEEAVRRAKEYVQGAIAAGSAYALGRGHGPVHHFWNYWR